MRVLTRAHSTTDTDNNMAFWDNKNSKGQDGDHQVEGKGAGNGAQWRVNVKGKWTKWQHADSVGSANTAAIKYRDKHCK